MFGRAGTARTLLAALALLLAAVSPAGAARVVSVADIHGDLDALRGILREAGIVDDAGAWIAGDATVVQTGDFLDRGPHFRSLMDYLRELSDRARRGGGRAVIVLGNHEVMNLLGDLRYVTAENYAEFADGKSEKRRLTAWKQAVRQARARAARLGLPEPDSSPVAQAAWMEAHPLGFVEQRAALAPGGEYGRWLRGLPAIASVGDLVFLHGGVSASLAGRSVEEIRARVQDELARFDRYRAALVSRDVIPGSATLSEAIAAVRQELDLAATEAAPEKTGHQAMLEEFLATENWYIRHPDGPLWFRGFAEWDEEEGTDAIAAIAAGLGASHFIVGHTPTADFRVRERFAGTVFLIDTGMLSSYYEGGRASALEIRDGVFTAIYPGERVPLWPRRGAGDRDAEAPLAADAGAHGPDPGSGEPLPDADPPARSTRWLGPDGTPLPFRGDDEVLEFLRTAKVIGEEIIRQGVNQPRKITLEKDGVQMHAVFRDVDVQQDVVHFQGRREMFFRDSYYFEPAAYELARMLGIDTVPPVVLRKIGATHGSLQMWVEQAMTEGKRMERGLQPPDAVDWNLQMQALRVFDALIYNTDRNQGNILIDGRWKLWMIDHTRAFRHHKTLPDAPGFAQCDRVLYERLKALDTDELRTRLKPYLRKAEIDGLVVRRGKLVEYIDQLAKDLGAASVFSSRSAS